MAEGMAPDAFVRFVAQGEHGDYRREVAALRAAVDFLGTSHEVSHRTFAQRVALAEHETNTWRPDYMRHTVTTAGRDLAGTVDTAVVDFRAHLNQRAETRRQCHLAANRHASPIGPAGPTRGTASGTPRRARRHGPAPEVTPTP
jgi:hypothetical protein